ncbi:MAG TPA: choice-of-anchor V domain-containing protein [Bacteroidia bacterium]|jgi:hypothetical protein|nr:choice-of-anchor V domain-containing protein [Bacteroidia bacterium]
MKKKITILLALAFVVIAFSAFTILHSAGIKWYTGSPWDGGSCGDCHGGGATVPGVAITANPAFGSGNTYMPGTTYTITATVSGSYSKYGFNFEILNSQSTTTAADAGTFGSALTANCIKYTTAGLPTTMSHNAASNGIFSFQWTAPASGSCFLYCAGLGANNDGTSGGDFPKLVNMTLVQSPVGITSYAKSAINLTLFPNPASERINLSYFLAERGEVVIELFSLRGEFITDLVKEVQDAGMQAIELRLPEGITKGMYFLKLRYRGEELAVKLLTH